MVVDSLKWIASMAAVMVLTLATPALSAGPCATVLVSLAPPVVARGGTVTAMASLVNCSGAVEKVTVNFKVETPFGFLGLGSFKLKLQADATHAASVTYRVPKWTPLGVYSVKVSVFDAAGTTLLSTSTASLTVVPL